ncbi:MAG: HAMP domain-containing histidine kinase [Scytolyngbya sp. HA4215-MV1]|jgi:hypothetical protein|nr:HAMP domain-containing histidine kinase [Scytolyngbya sp. HA4215-MV1]
MNPEWLLAGLGLSGLFGWWLGQRSRPHLPEATAPVLVPLVPSSEPSANVLAELQRTRLAYQMALEMSQFKAGFLARTSHELRSPLNGMIGMHQLILSDLCDSPEEERDFVGQAHNSALKMVKVLDEIIEVAKLEQGSLSLEIQPLQLAKVLDEVYRRTYLQAKNRNIRFQVSLPDPDFYILADPRWVKQILISLIDDAIVLMSEGDIRVSVQFDLAARYANIYLEDDRPKQYWQEAIDLLQTVAKPSFSLPNKLTVKAVQAEAQSLGRSSGMTLLMNQTLLELMNGQLQLLAVSSDNPAALNQLLCSLPLVPPETEE